MINVSAALGHPSGRAERELDSAFDYAASRGVWSIAAAGNQGTLGTSAITRHPAVIPVVACDGRGRPMELSNLGRSIGRWGVSAPGDGIVSLGPRDSVVRSGGTSAAAPFVSGVIALLWSEYPDATPTEIRSAIIRASGPRKTSVSPVLLDAAMADQELTEIYGRKLLEVT